MKYFNMPDNKIYAEKTYNIEFMKSTALTYLVAYRSLLHDHTGFEKYYNENMSPFIIPAAMFAALSCEIAIKAIICESFQRKEKGHDLEKLFFELPQERQLSIENRVVEFRTRLFDILSLKKNYSLEDFFNELSKEKDTFQDDRYFYEDDFSHSIDIDFLQAFAFALNNISCDDYIDFVKSNIICNK